MSVQLHLPGFDGSAALLMGELEQGRRPLDDVSVAAVSAQFRDWLREQEDADLLAAGELLRAGARLAALKSAHILATPADESVEANEPLAATSVNPLPARVAAWLGERQGSDCLAPVNPVEVTRRLAPRSPLTLLSALRDIEQRQSAPANRISMPAFLRLEVAVSSLIRRLKTGVTISLHHLLRGGSRQDAVVHFLAVLDLVRRRQATVSQAGIFDDITVERADHATGAESRAG